MKCSFIDLLLLNLNHFDHKWISYFNLIAPFANEISNVLTLGGVANLYPHLPSNDTETFKKAFFDFIALSGIISTTSHYSQKGYKYGLIKGVLFIIFTFLIPNIFMDNILNYAKTKNQKLILGFIVIYLLDFSINFFYCQIYKYLEKYEKTKSE